MCIIISPNIREWKEESTCFGFICRHADRSVFSNPPSEPLAGLYEEVLQRQVCKIIGTEVLVGDGIYRYICWRPCYVVKSQVQKCITDGSSLGAGRRTASRRSGDVQNWSLLPTESNARGNQIEARPGLGSGKSLDSESVSQLVFSKSRIIYHHMESTWQADIHWSHEMLSSRRATKVPGHCGGSYFLNLFDIFWRHELNMQ